MAKKLDDMALTPECVGDGQMQQVLAIEINPEAAFSLPIALQLAWSAVLGCYTGSNSVSFDLLHVRNQGAGVDQAFTGSTIKIHLQRNDSAQSSGSNGHGRFNTKITSPYMPKISPLCGVLHGSELVALRAIYKDSTWSSATIYFMLHQVRHALHLIAQPWSVSVSALQGISVEVQKQLMNWDTAPLREPRLETVWPTIERRCKEQPLKIAIESWDGRATYAELEQKVSAVAEELSRLRINPGTFVGLLLEKSMLSTVIILGFIKTGCAFVLLDTSQPTQRLKAMCQMAAVTTAVASPKNMEAGSGLGVTLHSTDDFPGLPSGEMSHIHAKPGSALYAGFTSGSTGEPKGFVIEHVNFMSGLDEYCAGVDLRHDSRVFLFASYSFVVSITGQLAPLSHGACLCIPSQAQLEHDLEGAIRDLRANWIAITPSAARILDPAGVLSLRTMVMVGEEMSSSDLARWRHLNLYSLYGQSENSKGTMIAKKTEEHAEFSIGLPYYANAWIVDRQDHNVLLPIGAEGELVIESPCLTRGYINNKRQGELLFVSNPEWFRGAGRQVNVRVFKTGDVARRNAADGSFQLLGRKGNRIKIRGQRVELSEVECQIRRLLPVARSVTVDIVCTAEDALKESPMLAAFILMRETLGCNKDAPLLATPTPTFQKQSTLLDAWLSDVLPSFMVPGAYVELAVMPKTSTGKLDRLRMREAAAGLSRRALLEYSSLKTAYKEPRSEEETIIRDLCEQILQLPCGEVGMNDTFIDLGGDSLMARHLITGARSSGLLVTLQEIFQPATLAQIAQSSRARKECETPHELGTDDFAGLREDFISDLPKSLRKEDIEDVFPTLELQAAYASNRMVDCFPLHVSGSVDVMRLHRACQVLVVRHAILRTVFHSFRGRLVQVVLHELDLPFSVQRCDSWNAAVHWVEEYGLRELKKQYDIGKPIMGFVLVTIPSEARHVLVMRLCHGQYDALCLRPLVQDLWAAYQGVPLLAKTEFKTHVEGCFRQRSSQAYNFWRGILKGSQPRPLFQRAAAADDVATLSLTTRQLPKIRPLAGATPASMIKTAWFEVLQHETRHDDIVFGQFLHVWTGNDGIIGPCMNILNGIQAQHAETASTDTLGWDDIVANSTDWPADTEVDPVVLHQNFDHNIEVISDGIACRKDLPILSHWAVFPMMLVTHPRESKLDALLLMSSRYLGLRDPVSMLNNFARALELLESHPDETMEIKDS
ncbi:hypothetical protein QQS21_006471 [Conoideocrella luteorostrata]|uniref:Carrier domain-containing protein n=1 Tax=Conoideocrella luteorostrata TaxID=1105319 RepID=A0AAJ0FSX3_9HYPO|nr:hypothetical protein QQS21_006471 [Conoideocrella luteorostrata]